MVKAVIFDMYETLVTLYNSPRFFSGKMAEIAGIPVEDFRRPWDASEDDRSVGKLTLEETVEMVLKVNNRYSVELWTELVERRKASKRDCFNHLHQQIVPMLTELKKRGMKVGLISNCFSEEAEHIHECELFPFFDVAMLSYEQGIMKPDEEIYRRCMDRLGVQAGECVYVGDGGRHELETAQRLGMKAVQAVWYLKEGTSQPAKRKVEFEQAESPMDVLRFI